MFKKLRQIILGRITFIGVMAIIAISGYSFVETSTVEAGSQTINGSVTSSDTYWDSSASHFRYRSSEMFEFTVDTPGDYYITNFSTSTCGLAYAVISDTSNARGSSVYDAVHCSHSSSAHPVALTTGVTYYAYALNYEDDPDITFSFDIEGPGCINDCPAPAAAAQPDPEPLVVTAPDNRINWQFGDGSAVLFRHESGDGVVVYCYVDGQTWVGMYLNQATVDNAGDTTQATPVMAHNQDGCHVEFYILDNGEYQINIYTWDGKLYEMIADNINFADATMREMQ